ncbi:MAG: hypothetical protein KC620_23670 [Myxococcales bacterium]|nr:hypothetical protein [Myxococcales bacterium]
MRRCLVLLLPAALLTFACADDDAADPVADLGGLDAALSDAAPDMGGPAWEVVAGADPHGLMLSAWSRSPGEVYFVGGQAETTGIARFDGQALSWLDNPGDRLAWWVFGFTEPALTFVVGERGLGLRREGDGPWTTFETGVDEGTLFGIWGSAPDDLWTVGGHIAAGGPPILRHWDGAAWRDAVVPDLGDAEPEAFFKVWGRGANDVFVCGDAGVILHFDGSEWHRLDTPGREAMFTVHGNVDSVWSVGGRARGVIWRLDGDRFVEDGPSSAVAGLSGVFVAPDGAVLAAGFNGLVLSRAPDGDWQNEPRKTTETLHAVWRTADGAVFAAGGTLQRFPGATEGVLLRRAAP